MDVRPIGCWSPVVTSLAYIFTVYTSCYYYFVSDMYCMHQAKEINTNKHSHESICGARCTRGRPLLGAEYNGGDRFLPNVFDCC